MKIERILGPSPLSRSIERIVREETGTFDVDAVAFDENRGERRDLERRSSPQDELADKGGDRGETPSEGEKPVAPKRTGLNVIA